MKKKRLIPILLFRNGWLVQSKGFGEYRNLGNPTAAVKRLSEWACDELIYLDISRDAGLELLRDDLGHPSRRTFAEIIADVAQVAFMPLTVGGGIRTIEEMASRIRIGADKVSINTGAVKNPALITEGAREFGSQCIVVSIDAKRTNDGYAVYGDGGQTETALNPVDWAREAEHRGAGEILLNSIDRDGRKTGYDLNLVGSVAEAVTIPVIACGGVGAWQHFAEALTQTKVDAVAAANIFHHSDQSVYLAKKYLYEMKLDVRRPSLLSLR